jgi:glycosyltransferase involved in cell wall biosynthesis
MTPHRPRVLVVQPLYAHYRYATLKNLAESDDLDFEFAAGSDTAEGDISVFDGSLLGRSTMLRNRWVGPILWQGGLVRLAFMGGYSAIVLTGSDSHASAWIASIAARLRGTKVLFWTTGWHRPDHGPRGAVRLAFYRLAHQLLLYNRRGLKIGAAAGYPESRMTVIFNSQGSHPVEVRSGSIGDPAPAPLPASDKPTVIAVVRLIPTKKLDLTIRAAALLADQGTAVRLVFAGDGPERERLRALAEGLGVELVLTGGIYDEDRLAALYATASVTVVPGPVGLTAVQSMRHGVPVVSHDNPDHQVAEWEAIHEGRTGGVFREDDVSDLARAISRWFLDDDGRRATAELCHAEYQEKWTPSSHAQRIAESVRAQLGLNTQNHDA